MKYSLLLLLCLAFFQSKADTESTYITAYYPVINQAELSIVANDYEKALSFYREAFSKVQEPFAKDIYNAAVCATLVNDVKQAFNYLEDLVVKGVELTYLERQDVFEPLHSHKRWKKFAKKYPKNRRKYQRKTDQDVRADLDELYARDQYFRQAKGGLRVYGDTLRKIENANVVILREFIDKYGYPGEALIGVADTLEDLPRFSIVIQRQTKAKKGYDFSPILKSAVSAGKLSPQAAAFLMDQQIGSNLYRSRVLVKVKCNTSKKCQEEIDNSSLSSYLTEKISEEEEEKVNTIRAEIGLESLRDYKRKVLYSLNDKRFKLNYTWSVTNYNVPSKEAAEVLTENLIAVE
ncbi:hypothetical protein [Pontibacter sp. SGAir0037]|uniref:hypothetical protein n=1 Tax=Pontibacter sp. SGAir0037 TaxID=2571030 RepID=UPI0010F8AF42|nr:hypothetical protein [Pontibacter sp. SGAir0037]